MFKGIFACVSFLYILLDKNDLSVWCSTNVEILHWVRVMHICAGYLNIIGSDNGLLPGRCQAIIWNNARILLIWTSRNKPNDISIEFHTFPFKKMHFKMSSAKWRPFCLGLSVLTSMWPSIMFSKRDLKIRFFYLTECYCFMISLYGVTLTHCGPVTPFDAMDLGRHWFR